MAEVQKFVVQTGQTVNPAGAATLHDGGSAVIVPATDVLAKRDASHTQADEFERFEDLTRKLVQVPKTEVDEQRG